MMKRWIYGVMAALIALATAGCGEQDAELIFSTEEISSPANVKVEYYSPDPSCVAKSYHITAGCAASQVVVRCTNARPVFFEIYGASTDEYVSTTGAWTAKVVNSDTIIFTFEEISQAAPDGQDIDYSILGVLAQTSKGTLSTHFTIARLTAPPPND